MRRKVAVLVVLAIGSATMWMPARKDRAEARADPSIEEAHRELVESITAPGTVELIDPVMIGAQVAGRIDAVFVEEGMHVVTGSLLATITTEAPRGRFRRTEIRAPAVGTVFRRDARPGAIVQPTDPLFTIARNVLGKQLVVQVGEADVAALTPNAIATFSVPAWPDRVFDGTLVRVREAPTRTEEGTTYAAIIEVPDPGNALRAGMSASVRFVPAARAKPPVASDAALVSGNELVTGMALR